MLIEPQVNYSSINLSGALDTLWSYVAEAEREHNLTTIFLVQLMVSLKINNTKDKTCDSEKNQLAPLHIWIRTSPIPHESHWIVGNFINSFELDIEKF